LFPFDVMLVGLTEDVIQSARDGLAQQIAEVKAEVPTARMALESLDAKETKPPLFVVQVRCEEDLEGVNFLATQRPTAAILALLDGEMELPAALAVNRAGANQIVSLPIDPCDFSAALLRMSAQAGIKMKASRVIAVCGVTGGCGATTIAINLAYELATQLNLSTVLMELSFQIGMLATYLEFEPKANMRSLLDAGNRLDPYLVKQCLTPITDKLSVLPGPPHMSEAVRVEPATLLKIIDYARRLASVVVVDVPCTYNDLQFEVLAAADDVCLVGEQTIPSIRSLRLVRETFTPEKAAKSVRVILNRFSAGAEGFGIADLQPLLGESRIHTVGGDQGAVVAALNQGKTLRQVAPNSTALAHIGSLARDLVGMRENAPKSATNGSGIFRRLLGSFQR
jgi:pilus assembly protein CpaE